MAWAVVTAAGGIPVINVTALSPALGGVAATVNANGIGTPVSVVTPPMPGMPIRFVSVPP
jgi:hypothetical protein